MSNIYKNLSVENIWYLDQDGVLFEEGWKFILDTDFYLISNLGRVKSYCRRSPVIIGQIFDQHGYLKTYLSRVNKIITIHRMVAICFIPNPENKPQVNHKKGVKTDNRYFELEWMTSSENHKHAYSVLKRVSHRAGLFGEKNSNFGKVGKLNKLTDIIKCNETGEIFYGCKEAAKAIGVHHSSISAHLRGVSKTTGGKTFVVINRDKNGRKPKTKIKTCIGCGKEYETMDRVSVYCSIGCSRTNNVKKPPAKMPTYTCLCCGIEFSPKDHPDRPRMFCSQRCSKVGDFNPRRKNKNTASFNELY